MLNITGSEHMSGICRSTDFNVMTIILKGIGPVHIIVFAGSMLLPKSLACKQLHPSQLPAMSIEDSC